jgi:hypothetical protein
MPIQRNDNLTVAVAFEAVFFGKIGSVMFVAIQFSIYDRLNVFLTVVKWLVP